MNDIVAIITEELQNLYEQQNILTIPDLARALEVHGYDKTGQGHLQKMLSDAYRKAGDQGVIDLYAKIAGVQIQALRNGRYMFANLGGGGQPQLESLDVVKKK
jgi:hypothetical protein